uniref:BHLH domain-containing protein n=1 Tax=Globisporangium ultimum (strain ATCC 200006 / CBS 805.95 / DAOM BR144) TaxID=431595 RepID=K3W9N4_GLOUD
MLTDSSYLGLESTDGNASTEDSDQHTAGVSNSGAIASRLLQLENNYERKKKRAKINRKDLNARFQELMEILNLKEDRKLNRAKILEKTIEYIEKLEDELHAAKSQLDPKKATTVSPPNQPAPSPQMLLHNPSPSHAIGSGGPLMTFDPTNPHAWSATGHPAMPMTPMMWLPCSMMAPSGATLRNQRTRAEKRSTVRGGKPKQVAPGPSSTFMQTSVPASVTVEGARRNLKRSRESSTAEASTPVNSTTAVVSTTVIQASKSEAASERLQSVFAWSAQEIPAVLAFCDAWMLARLMQTSKELGGAARQNKLWIELSRRRWGICGAQLQLSNALEQWKRWDREIYMPACGSTISGSIRFASGRVKDIHIWGLLARRSNGRTTRTVLQSGKATVMQVVEIYLVVQNMSQARVHLTDQISVSPIGNASAAASSSAFEPFPSGSNLCVLDIFLQCPGLDLEQEFLQRAAWLSVECKSELSQRTGAAEAVTVRAQCLDEAQKKQLISTSYSSLDVEP